MGHAAREYFAHRSQISTEGNHSPSSVVIREIPNAKGVSHICIRLIREIRVIKKTQRSPQADANANCYFKEHESHESYE